MTAYNYIGFDTKEDYWNEIGNRNDSYYVRSYGLADTILIGYGTMDIDAGDGNDTVRFFGRGIASLGNGDDSGTIGAQDGDSSVYGDAGDDYLFAFGGYAIGSLAAYGGTGEDYFTISEGSDVLLNGGSGFDCIDYPQNGLFGKTLVSIEGQAGSNDADIIDSWGTDDVAITSSSASLFAELGIKALRNVLIGGGGADSVNGSGGSDFLNGSSMGNGNATLRAIANFRSGLEGLNGDVILTTTEVDSAIDTLTGNGGNDFLIGGYGGDSVDGGDGVDTVAYVERYHGDGGIAVDLVAGSASDGDTLTSVENVVGTRQAGDLLLGNSQRNVFFGLGGDDSLDGRTGTDLLDGGDGNDHLVDADGGDTLRGGDGDDSYTVSFKSSRIVETTAGYNGGGRDTVFADITWRLGDNIENLTLVVKNDQAGNPLDGHHSGYGNALDNTLTGNRGNNLLDGGTGSDTLAGGAGNDTYVTDGLDTITEAAGAGTDTVRSSVTMTLGANLENLTLTGTAIVDGTGNGLDNTLTGNAQANTLDGGEGNDTLIGGAGIDTLIGGIGNDTYVTERIDTIIEVADAGIDTVQSAATSILAANLENLSLTGEKAVSGTGNELGNTLIGNGADNVLAALGGLDKLVGGGGADTFVYKALSDSTVASTGRDTITDFNRAEGDRIDLRQIDANARTSANEAFTFVNDASFSKQAGELRAVFSGTNTLVSGDVDGNGVADFAIALRGNIAFQSGDFVL